LLYTAITRGKKLVVVCTNQRALKIALSNYLVEPRNSMLVERLGGRGREQGQGQGQGQGQV
ncbi:MAG TPA: hypothetical protein PLN07_11195, partial [Myxococcota bacterium]|nr:hypothetical protein [Myxococcota bacterium]